MKAVAVVSAGSVAGGGYCDALVRWNRGAGKLADHPAVGKLIGEYNRVAIAGGFAGTIKTTPECRNTNRAEDGCAGGLVKHLKAFVYHLHVLRCAHFAIRIGRRAVARHTWKSNAVKVERRTGHVHIHKTGQVAESALHNRIRG